jgi:hypothetical protein
MCNHLPVHYTDWSSPVYLLFVLYHAFLLLTLCFQLPFSASLPFLSFNLLSSYFVSFRFLFLRFPFVLIVYLPMYLITRNADLHSLLTSVKFQITFPHVSAFQSVLQAMHGFCVMSGQAPRNSGTLVTAKTWLSALTSPFTSYLFI